ncbi:uncharacterized protein LOC129596203 isoform X2 [Paramacrobiotus metropolitanus]|nr:uncharacterized protein LOC129596203 isoform X2 [Paramacrobiotus metropolitanus]
MQWSEWSGCSCTRYIRHAGEGWLWGRRNARSRQRLLEVRGLRPYKNETIGTPGPGPRILVKGKFFREKSPNHLFGVAAARFKRFKSRPKLGAIVEAEPSPNASTIIEMGTVGLYRKKKKSSAALYRPAAALLLLTTLAFVLLHFAATWLVPINGNNAGGPGPPPVTSAVGDFGPSFRPVYV